jgi:ABC-type branched-subunit amino acid transport system substrate-binding protein
MYVTTTATAVEGLSPPGRRFVREFAPTQPGGALSPYVLETAEAAEIVVDAISRSDGSRASVLKAMRATRIRAGILGSLRFDASGDKTPGTATIYRITGKRLPGIPLQLRGSVYDRAITVPANLLR